jgi:hypothetical protein
MFCTYLTVYAGDKLPPFFVGSSSVARVQDGYHGSVRSQALRAVWELELMENLSIAHRNKLAIGAALRGRILSEETKAKKRATYLANRQGA